MSNFVEQKVCLKFCVTSKISCEESLKMLQKAFGSSGLLKTGVYEWYKDFKSNRTMVEDFSRFGRPSMAKAEENVEKVKEIVI